MNPQAEELNQAIKDCNESVLDLLSEKGKSIFFPKKGILAQTAEAKGKDINATIGIALEEDGSPMRLKFIAKTFRHCVWLNPVPENRWGSSLTISKIKQIFPMFELSLDGLEKAVCQLMKQ